jgi:hypothetical protein
LYVRLNQAETNRFPAARAVISVDGSPGRDCENMKPAGLDAGTLVGQPPVGPAIRVASPAITGGETTALLPTGTVSAGPYSIRAPGGRDVGAFNSAVRIPDPIQVPNQYPPGTTLFCDSGYGVTWTGGDDSSLVMVTFRTVGSPLRFLNTQLVPASQGFATVVERNFPGPCSGEGNFRAEIIVTQMPREDLIPTFSANGLTLGGRHTWKYEWRFEDLRR